MSNNPEVPEFQAEVIGFSVYIGQTGKICISQGYDFDASIVMFEPSQIGQVIGLLKKAAIQFKEPIDGGLESEDLEFERLLHQAEKIVGHKIHV